MKNTLKVNLIGVYLLIFLLLLIVIPIQAYRSLTLDPLLRSLVFVGSAGGLGGTIYCIRGYYKTRVSKPFDLNFTWWYIYRPFVSIVVGVFVYFLLVGGLLTISADSVQLDLAKTTMFYCVLSFLGGFSFTEFANGITELAATTFAKLGKPSETDEATADYSQRFKDQLTALGLTSSDLKMALDDIYNGTSTVKSETETRLWNVKIEMFKTEKEAKDSYDKLIAEEKDKGYSDTSNILDFSKINLKERWEGKKPPADQCVIYYVFESDMQGAVTTLTSSVVDNTSK